jgi:hypothetical protein
VRGIFKLGVNSRIKSGKKLGVKLRLKLGVKLRVKLGVMSHYVMTHHMSLKHLLAMVYLFLFYQLPWTDLENHHVGFLLVIFFVMLYLHATQEVERLSKISNNTPFT